MVSGQEYCDKTSRKFLKVSKTHALPLDDIAIYSSFLYAYYSQTPTSPQAFHTKSPRYSRHFYFLTSLRKRSIVSRGQTFSLAHGVYNALKRDLHALPHKTIEKIQSLYTYHNKSTGIYEIYHCALRGALHYIGTCNYNHEASHEIEVGIMQEAVMGNTEGE